MLLDKVAAGYYAAVIAHTSAPMRTLRAAMLHLPVLVLLASSAPGWATEVGLDPGAPLWGGSVNTGAWDAVPTTNVQWVRVNFRIDQWSSPHDQTPHGPMGLSWFGTYDAIVNAYLSRGIRVYGVLSDELVPPPVPNLDSQAFYDAFWPNALEVVDHFKDRVRTFEVINEPNLPGRMQASSFARILQQVYLTVKHDGGHNLDPSWQVTLVSGPLDSNDGSTAVTYLADTYAAGRNQLAWDWTKTNTGSYPLDAVGYHIYVAQSATDSLCNVTAKTTANLSALWNTIVQKEGANTSKQIWVSEFGWRADVVGDTGQADRLEAGFNAMKASGHVAAAFWFQLQDFSDGTQWWRWGLYSSEGLDPAHRRPSANRLQTIAMSNSCIGGGSYFSSGSTHLLYTVNGVSGSVDAAMPCGGPYTWSLSSGSCPGWYTYSNGQHMYCGLPSYGSATFTATFAGQNRTITFYRNN